MLRITLTSSRVLRVCAFGLTATAAAIVFTTGTAEARHRHHSAARHEHAERESYSPAFASIIVDANSGATLASNSPDGLRHPASLTKIMTLYLLFERLQSGKMTLDTEMPVSQHAADQEPTKLGLRPGQMLRVEDAIKGIVTRSANDAAVVVAEAIGGSEDDFCKMMTRKARALGMSRTVYVDASGLPNDDQITTARDQATLGRAIQERFPRYYRYFSTLAFNYHGQVIRNHNHLLGSVEGVDGIKTGYTRASGFNLVTNLRRGNRHIVGVVMGGRSGGSRDAIMRTLLAENLDKAATTLTVAAVSDRNPAESRCGGGRGAIAAGANGYRTRSGRGAGTLEPAGFPINPRCRCRRSASGATQARACAVYERGHSDAADFGDPRLIRADEAGQGEDRPDQGRADEDGLGRTIAVGPAHPQRRTTGTDGSAGDVGCRRCQSGTEQGRRCQG